MEAAGNRKIQYSLPPPHPYPWLYFNGKGGAAAEETQYFCPISLSDHATKTYQRNIPELGAARLWTVQHGWCLLANYHTENRTKLFLWNPSSLAKIKLPLFKYQVDVAYDHVLVPSPTEDHHQICSIYLFPTSTSIIYWHLGDKQWTQVDYYDQLLSAPAMEGEEFQQDNIGLFNPIYYNGCLYAESFSKPHLLVEIKKLEPTGLQINSCHIFSPRAPPQSFTHGRKSKMLESNNELFRFEILYSHSKLDQVVAVLVYKLDFPAKVWHKVESNNIKVKDKVFFISNVGSSFACQAINPETEGGRVYFSLKKHDFVYIYNIQDKTIIISQPFLNLPKKRSRSSWFMPDLRTIGSLKQDIGMARIKEKETSTSTSDDSNKTRDMVTCDEFPLPQDIVEAIAKRIDIGIDYLHFRAANKLFRSSAPPIQSASPVSMSRFHKFSLSPLFVYFEKDGVISKTEEKKNDSVLTFVHPKLGLKNKYNTNLTLDLQSNCEISYSKDGWLLMVVNKLSSFFFNPFAKEKRRLADRPDGEHLNTRCIACSHSPTSSECKVVQFERNPGGLPKLMVWITKLGVENWQDFRNDDLDFPLYNISPVFHNGNFYYLSKRGKLGVLKVEEEVIYFDKLEKPYAPCTGYYNSFLAECSGDILSIFEDCFGNWVRVFKLNESTMTWIRVENLGNHMLFVGNTSFSAMANVPGMENKIYFPRFYGQNIVFYSLKTNNYHTFESNEVVNFHCMKEQVNSSWIEQKLP